MNENLVLPDSAFAKIVHLIKLILTDPWIFSGLSAAFVASLFWMMAMTKFQISYAYPFMSSAFILVLLISVPLFGETLNATKLIGTLLIVTGLVVLSRGYTA